MSGKKDVATTTGPQLPAEVKEFLEQERQREIEAHGIETPAIEIIHGKELFQMPDGNTCKSFEAVLLAEQRINIRWIEGQDVPDCVASDAMNGSKYGKCAHCRFNEFGSDPKGGGGKDCKNQSVLLLWRMDEPTRVPFRITVAPTGLKNDRARAARDIRKGAAGLGLPAIGVVGEFSLEHQEGSGREWSVLAGKPTAKSLYSGDITAEQMHEFRRIADACQSHAVERTIAEGQENAPETTANGVEIERRPVNDPNAPSWVKPRTEKDEQAPQYDDESNKVRDADGNELF